MVQGVLAGIGSGLTYVPSMAVISQHFSKRRTLAMSFVASGTPLGAVIHPIMLNHLFNGHVGFSRGVLASAGFVSTLLLIACLSMRTRALPTPSGANYSAAARTCFRDLLFILMTTGYVVFWRAPEMPSDVEGGLCPGQCSFRFPFISLYFTCSWTLSNMGLASISHSALYVLGSPLDPRCSTRFSS